MERTVAVYFSPLDQTHRTSPRTALCGFTAKMRPIWFLWTQRKVKKHDLYETTVDNRRWPILRTTSSSRLEDVVDSELKRFAFPEIHRPTTTTRGMTRASCHCELHYIFLWKEIYSLCKVFRLERYWCGKQQEISKISLVTTSQQSALHCLIRTVQYVVLNDFGPAIRAIVSSMGKEISVPGSSKR